MAKRKHSRVPLPAPHIIKEVQSRDIADYDGLIAWWQSLPDEFGWLRGVPADLALKMALAGVPNPTRWATGLSTETPE